MAEIIQEETGKGGRKKAHPPHIDMTPMVDLMCLLITFFMLTTAFSKAKVMEINLPEKLKNETDAPKISASRTLNLIIGPDNKVYYYPGRVEDFNNLPPIQQTLTFGSGEGSLRAFLLDRNKTLARKIKEYEQEVKRGTYGVISQDSVQKAVAQMKKVDDTGPIILIKAHEDAKYGNFVDIIDEMTITGIARYTFVDIAWYEERMVDIAAGRTPAATATSSVN